MGGANIIIGSEQSNIYSFFYVSPGITASPSEGRIDYNKMDDQIKAIPIYNRGAIFLYAYLQYAHVYHGHTLLRKTKPYILNVCLNNQGYIYITIKLS